MKNKDPPFLFFSFFPPLSLLFALLDLGNDFSLSPLASLFNKTHNSYLSIYIDEILLGSHIFDLEDWNHWIKLFLFFEFGPLDVLVHHAVSTNSWVLGWARIAFVFLNLSFFSFIQSKCLSPLQFGLRFFLSFLLFFSTN